MYIVFLGAQLLQYWFSAITLNVTVSVSLLLGSQRRGEISAHAIVLPALPRIVTGLHAHQFSGLSLSIILVDRNLFLDHAIMMQKLFY